MRQKRNEQQFQAKGNPDKAATTPYSAGVMDIAEAEDVFQTQKEAIRKKADRWIGQ